jgi:AraC family transcriptional regulator of adaptative response / methylphosphotriester-DNA alkyltransferase methyltransferase
MAHVLTEPMWQAIVQCDPSYDQSFYYGVSTTGIFCRPSCRSRTPSRVNVLVFRKAEEALLRQYRPCKRCRPDGLRLPDEEWTGGMAKWIREHYAEPVTLDRLAEVFHASPYHLQRTFKKTEGVTPAVYLILTRMGKARDLLSNGNLAVSEIAATVGISGAAYFSTLFAKETGLTPTQYRQQKRKAGNGHET